MKRKLRILLVLLLCLVCSFSSFATLATDSNVGIATDSNLNDIDDSVAIDYITPVMRSILRSAGVEEVENTVDLTNVVVSLAYYNMSGVIKEVAIYCNSSGYFSISKPDDFVSAYGIYFRINKGGLPPSGNYTFQLSFGSNTGGFTYNSATIHGIRTITNSTVNSVATSVSYTQSSGNLNVNSSVSISSLSYIQVNTNVSGLIPPVGGYVSVRFVPTSGTVELESPTLTESQVQDNIASNTENIASGVADVNDSLKEIIQTISNQLEALWNQMYNYIHLEDMANADKNADKIVNNQNENTNQIIDNQDENTEDIIDALDGNTSSIIQNNNNNTNTIVNGYDSSSLDNSSDQLNDTLTQYDDVGNSISESMGSYFDDFEYDDISGYPTGVLSSLLFFGNYLQSIFESIGNFNLPITLGLTITFVLMLIGYFRYGR